MILTDKGIFVIEFNCRLGDPETQVLLPTINFDLIELIESCVDTNNKNIFKPTINKKAVLFDKYLELINNKKNPPSLLNKDICIKCNNTLRHKIDKN